MHVIVATDGSEASLVGAEQFQRIAVARDITDVTVVAVVSPYAAVPFANELTESRNVERPISASRRKPRPRSTWWPVCSTTGARRSTGRCAAARPHRRSCGRPRRPVPASSRWRPAVVGSRRPSCWTAPPRACSTPRPARCWCADRRAQRDRECHRLAAAGRGRRRAGTGTGGDQRRARRYGLPCGRTPAASGQGCPCLGRTRGTSRAPAARKPPRPAARSPGPCRTRWCARTLAAAPYPGVSNRTDFPLGSPGSGDAPGGTWSDHCSRVGPTAHRRRTVELITIGEDSTRGAPGCARR